MIRTVRREGRAGWSELEPTVLVPHAAVLGGGSVFLAPGLAAVVAGTTGGRLVSHVREH